MASDEVTPISQLGYEKCRDELIEVVRLLEQGGLDLDTSLQLWERGEQLAKRCEEHLAGARKRITDKLAAGEPDDSLHRKHLLGFYSKLEHVSVILGCMAEFSGISGTAAPTAPLGRVLVTGGSGFVGANLVTTLLDQGYQVRSLDRAPSPLPQHPQLEVLQGDICDAAVCAAAVDAINTVFHTAAIIELMGGASVTDEYRQRSFSVN